MNLPNDMLPEEREPQYAEMITLLQQAYSKPVPASWERPQQTLSRVRARLMRADLATSSTEEMPIPGVIDSAPSKSKPLAGKHHLNALAAVLIISALLGGGFGLYVSLGRGSSTPLALNVLSLQVAPASIAPGGVITLRGSHFSPGARVGLTRDTSIPIIDTSGVSIINADAGGSFSDTVIIDGTWPAGSHMLHAEDARLHKIASFSIFVTGNSLSSRPPHLVLSTSDVDLGSGDQATDSTQTIVMSNAGGGQIAWQTSVTQPWLLLSPASGTFSVGQQIQVTLTVERSKLSPGTYTCYILFTSNAGAGIISVKMEVMFVHPIEKALSTS